LDAGDRIRVRLEEKAKQTLGGPPAWVRLEVDPGFFGLTDLAHQPMRQRLERLSGAVDYWLRDSPHIHGVVLSTDVVAGDGPDRTELLDAAVRASSPLILPPHIQAQRQVATGPSAMLRCLPHRRVRLVFVLPAADRAISGGLGEPLRVGGWYDAEGSWLSWAVETLGWPTLELTQPA